MNYLSIPRNSILAEWLNETPALNEWEQNELENEFESWTEKFKSFWQRNKAKAQKLGAAAGIISRLLSPGTPSDTPKKPPIEQKAAADLQRIENRRRRDQAAAATPDKPPISGGKELENTLLGEILTESHSHEAEYEMAVLTSELSAIYEQLKRMSGMQSIRAEMLFGELEEELRKDVRKNHFKSGYNPTGVEIHHWFPLKYAALLPENIKSKINTYTVALDRVSHAYVGKAIDLYLEKNKNYAALRKFLDVLGRVEKDGVKLNPAIFVRKDRNHQATAGIPTVNNPLKPDGKFYGLRNINNFRDLMGKIGVNTKQLELQFLP